MRIQEIPVCHSSELAEKDCVLLDVEYRGEAHSAIVLRYGGGLYAYLNQCVHMPRRLDCEQDTVFDEQRRFLRCSMHGIVYQPETGESLSAVCPGRKLTPLRLRERNGKVVLLHKHLRRMGSGGV